MSSSDDEDEEVVVNSLSEDDDEEELVKELVPSEDTKEDVKQKEPAPSSNGQLLSTLLSVQHELDTMKQSLRKRIESGRFPLNPLDELVDQLGGESKVAEMTGRSHRVLRHRPGCRDSSTEYFRKEKEARLMEEGKEVIITDDDIHLNESYCYYESRGIKRGSDEGVNILEKKRFQNGEKLIAVISEAASAGISLQSDRRVPNQKKRIHIILELPWSADKMIQQCGRSHRSNQSVPPDYIFLLSAIGGEIRFISTISKRLRALGALTQGSRNATGALDFSQFDLNSQYGRAAIRVFLRSIFQPSLAEYYPNDYGKVDMMSEEEIREYSEYQKAKQVNRLTIMELWLSSVGITWEKESNTILFNRILGLEIFKQHQLVQYLMDVRDEMTYHVDP